MLAIQAKDQSKKLEFNQAENLSVVLATRLYFTNARDLNQFVYFIQLDIKKPEIYIKVIQTIYAIEWARVIEDDLDQLYKNKTQILIPRKKIELGH